MAEDTAKVVLELDVDKARKQLDLINKTIEELNANTDDTEELVKNLEKQWDKLNDEINNAGKGQRNLAKELKEVTKQLQVMKLNGQENTAEYQKLVVQAGALKDAMGDTAQVIKNVASDTSNLDAALGALGAASGGFSIITSAYSALGGESEKAEKMQKKLLQAIALVNGVQQLQNTLNKDSALMVKLNSVAHSLFAKQMQATAVATNGATTAMKGFKTALVSTGIGALVVALGFLVEKLIQHNEEAEKAKSDEDALKSSMDKLKESTDFLAGAYDRLTKAKKAYYDATFESASDEDKLKLVATAMQETQANIDGAKKQVEAYEKQVTKTGKVLDSARQQYQIFGGDKFKQAYEEAQAAFNNANANLQGSQALVTEFETELTNLQKKQSEITKKMAKDAKTASDKVNKYTTDEIQSRLNAAKMRTESLKEEFETYSKSVDAESSISIGMRKKYGDALKDQLEIEKELLGAQRKNAISSAEGNAKAIKAAEQNYKNGIDAIKNANDKFANNMDDTAATVRSVFAKNEAEIQLFIDNIMKDIDSIESRTKNLTLQNEITEKGRRTFQTAFKANEDPEYVAETKRIQSQIENYKRLADNEIQYKEYANQAIEALNAEQAANDEFYANKKREAWKMAMAEIGSYVGATLNSIADMQDQESERGFENAKKLQYAATVVNTLSAMMAAYTSMVGVPYVGPALAAAAMTAAAAAGAVQLKQISETEYGGKKGVSSSGAASGRTTNTGTSSVNTAILSRQLPQQPQQPKTEYVAIVDEITFKQKQQNDVQKVSVI